MNVDVSCAQAKLSFLTNVPQIQGSTRQHNTEIKTIKARDKQQHYMAFKKAYWTLRFAKKILNPHLPIKISNVGSPTSKGLIVISIANI